MKSSDRTRQKPLNPRQKLYLKCLFHLRLGHLHPCLPLQPPIIVGNHYLNSEHLVSSLTHTTQLCMVIDYIGTLHRAEQGTMITG